VEVWNIESSRSFFVLATSRFIAGISALVLVAACAKDNQGSAGSSTGATQASSSGVDLNGAGATFPQPIYNKWFSDYAAKTGVKINYQSIGSGGGVRQISEQTVDFGATDGPMKDDELAKAKGGAIMHFPTVLGAVVMAYNVPEIPQPLKLTGPVIADIFLGKIKKWNDARISALNPGVKLPPNDILVVHRSDGSGTTFVFTDYLATISPEWAKAVGRNKEVQWPAGIGAKGNEGVAGQVKQTPYAIGYTELAYVKQNKLQSAVVRNAAGQFVEPSIASITAAAEGAKLPPNTDYLSKTSATWKSAVGRGTSVRWPVGLGGKGNEGVTQEVKQSEGSIGYVELIYALANQLPAAEVENATGRFVTPSLKSVTAAAAGATFTPDSDFRVSITDAAGPEAYPISSFTWLLIYKNQTDAEKARKLKDFLRWAYTEGEGSASALDYAPLPAGLTQRLTARLDSIQVGGKS
jgi:phosphate transport system substrate-binding protein